ncbi:MAG: sugar phosphate isomerase/epimerase [Planctomycetota bacterium]|nr:sugar phosphate isomerase/epimerase [Planctomycetota bacterium]
MFKNLSCGALGHKASFEETVKLAREFGFGGVDLDLKYAREHGAEATRKLIVENGLSIGGFAFQVAFRENDTEKAWATSLGNLARDAELAAEIGATRCATWVPPTSAQFGFRTHYERFVERLRPAAAMLQTFGISVGFEFIGPRTLRAGKLYGFLHTMDGMRAACACIGENAGLLLDCWHWYTCKSTVTDLEQLEPGDVIAVHLNDAPKGIAVDEQNDHVRELPAATGVIDIAGFLKSLRKLHYNGPITVEPFNQPLKEMPLREAVKATKDALDKAYAQAGLS